jgi:Ser/Thr protein kinase RdoA (MazF antagonist)
MMQADVTKALAAWGMLGGPASLAARRENTVWRVTHKGRDYALRFHRPGYRSLAELNSELIWMAALADQGLSVPIPQPLVAGGWVGQVGTHYVSMLSWMDGRPIGAGSALLDITDRTGLCHQLGETMARLHDLSDAFKPPVGFARPDWRRAGLLGDDPLWGRFWTHPHLNDNERLTLERVRRLADDTLAKYEDTADQGLIHADLLTENILINEQVLTLIDFDDGAIGFRDFELATFLMRFLDAPDYMQMRAALCEGYSARRVVDMDQLDLFILLRALTYPGWIMARLSEPGAAERSDRALRTALTLARDFEKRRL